jgi:hypothetical protein
MSCFNSGDVIFFCCMPARFAAWYRDRASLDLLFLPIGISVIRWPRLLMPTRNRYGPNGCGSAPFSSLDRRFRFLAWSYQLCSSGFKFARMRCAKDPFLIVLLSLLSKKVRHLCGNHKRTSSFSRPAADHSRIHNRKARSGLFSFRRFVLETREWSDDIQSNR